MYPLLRPKSLSVIFTNLCWGNGTIFKKISPSVMVSCFKLLIDVSLMSRSARDGKSRKFGKRAPLSFKINGCMRFSNI